MVKKANYKHKTKNPNIKVFRQEVPVFIILDFFFYLITTSGFAKNNKSKLNIYLSLKLPLKKISGKALQILR